MELTKEITNIWNQNDIDIRQLSLYYNNIKNLTLDYDKINKNNFLFNHEVDNSLPITDQKSSGRCWLFAACNLIRNITYQKWNKMYDINIKDLEISQSYIYFWDKLERYNRLLRYYIQINEMPAGELKNRYLFQLYQDPMGDGGQWDMAKDIIKKYGIIPKQIMPDSYHAKKSSEMNKILTFNLKNDFNILDSTTQDNLIPTIQIMVNNIYNILVGFLGKPPNSFNWSFKSKNKVLTWTEFTPLSFLKKTGFEPDEWISIVNDPRPSNTYNSFYQIEYLGNVYNQHVGWINLDMNRIKQLVKTSIDNNIPVWFGCDISSERDRSSGIMDLNIHKISQLIPYNNTLTKGKNLELFSSLPNHAMLTVGYYEHNSNISRWKIENSWGLNSGNKGYLLMTDNWMDKYVFQVVINKKFLTQAEQNILTMIPNIIPPWDPLGTLA